MFLKRYEQPLVIKNKTDGYYNDSGQWIPGTNANVNIRCPVVPMSNDDLVSAEGGQYTSNDRKIFVHQELELGQDIETDNKTYKVHAEKDYSQHATGLRMYVIVRRGESGD